MAVLKLENIDKIYDNGFHAVYDFSMEIADGEFVVFVGPSGCGKSTMLRMIAGLEAITKGKFLIDGRCVNDLAPKARGIAMVFQSYALYPHLSVYDNMAFGLELEGYDGDFIERRVQKTAKILGLSTYLDRFPRELSGGQRQRVAVGRAIIREPKVFLMDEPLSNLDAKQRVSMRAEIKDVHRKTGATSIYVTHDQTEAMTMADRIVVMKDGRVQQIGTPHELYFNPVNKFVAGFLGEPPMNFVPVTLKNGTVEFESGESLDAKRLGLTIADGEKLDFAFRPEAATLSNGEEGCAVFKAEVELTELLGDTVNIYTKIAGHKIIIKCAPELEPEMGSQIVFSIPFKSIYIFDTKGKAVETAFKKGG